jgi:RNA polymerase sigma factor (sigma-70 family)
MNDEARAKDSAARGRLHDAYTKEKPKLLNRLRSAGRSIEEAEDLIHDVYAETMERLPLLDQIRNLPAWINSLFKRRVIDAWRKQKVREKRGETDVAEETLREILVETGLDPLDSYVRDCMMDAMNDAMEALPKPQREVIEAQVFGGKTFRDIAENTGVSIDTLTARKRYGIRTLAKALRHWLAD